MTKEQETETCEICGGAQGPTSMPVRDCLQMLVRHSLQGTGSIRIEKRFTRKGE